jgi:hypothetical protein
MHYQLVRIYGGRHEGRDSRKAVDVLYFDFVKAFDKVPIKRLTSKLAAAGICGILLKWITDWLTDR